MTKSPRVAKVPKPISLRETIKRAKDEDDLTQAEKFAQAAREHGADQDEDAFKGVLRKLGKAKATK